MLPPSRFSHPGGPPGALVEFLDAAGLGLARSRIATLLGNPDPFALRAELGRRVLAGDVAALPANVGGKLTADEADAALVRAAVDGAGAAGSAELAAARLGLVGLFAGRPPGPRVRAVPVDDQGLLALRFPRAEAPPSAAAGRVERWTTGEIGDMPAATIRCIVEVPGGVALGSDYGLTLWRGGRFQAFPWPAGSRREARRVEAMAVERGTLWVATSQALVSWSFSAEPTTRKHGADGEEGWDELRCLLTGRQGLLRGYRTSFEGGAGPADTFAMAEAAGGVVYAGTGAGELHVVDGGGPVRRFSAGPHQPVRHLAFADGVLHVAAGGQHHRFDGASWTAAAPEPTAFAVDRRGRLWLLAEGRLFVVTRGATTAVPTPVERPWSLCAAGDKLWIGGRETLAALTILAA